MGEHGPRAVFQGVIRVAAGSVDPLAFGAAGYFDHGPVKVVELCVLVDKQARPDAWSVAEVLRCYAKTSRIPQTTEDREELTSVAVS